MNQVFRDTFKIIASGKDSDGNKVVLFSDSSQLNDLEISVLGVGGDATIYGVKTVFKECMMPRAISDLPHEEPETISGTEINASRLTRALAQKVFDVLTH